jgi:DNA-binding transcriptional MerR regulator
MPEGSLLTIRQLADALGLPESTVRYYRDAFADAIPAVGQGRRRRYPPEALDIFRTIAAGYAGGMDRAAIRATLARGLGVADPVVGREAPAGGRGAPGVTNLDLLAAILDGEREQRDALWQVAGEVVRLGETLERQDAILGLIAGQAGVDPAALPPTPEIPIRGAIAAASMASSPESGEAPRPDPELERLRTELEAERALVERLREAKVHVERRATEAEAALAEQQARRLSLLRRLLGGQGEP